MLMLNMAGLTEADLERIVANRCSLFGSVASIRVLQPGYPARYSIALVRMVTAVALDKVVAHLGDSKSGATAIIRLEQGKKPKPAALKLRRRKKLPAAVLRDAPARAKR
ncbi:MAG: hypothetical protein HY527_20440 [Betaproteobacteria bacterium]|nr:hypothetical protein [Betaproteobacteria bacterium]